jgi:hypothetical protein
MDVWLARYMKLNIVKWLMNILLAKMLRMKWHYVLNILKSGLTMEENNK